MKDNELRIIERGVLGIWPLMTCLRLQEKYSGGIGLVFAQPNGIENRALMEMFWSDN